MLQENLTIETQLKELRSCGIRLNIDVVEADLLMFDNKEELETEPYQGLVKVLGHELERKPYGPIANMLWMCDYERIEDHGDYASIVKRLELMTNFALELANIKDFVNIDTGVAWVEFMYRGEQIHWDAEVEDDWMDPYLIVKYDELLKASGKDVRIYSNHTDYGQIAFFAAFSSTEFNCFCKLSRIKLALIELQA